MLQALHPCAQARGNVQSMRGDTVATVFEKLNLKHQREIVVVNAPDSFAAKLDALKGVVVQRDPAKVSHVDFTLVFAIRQAEVDEMTRLLVPKMQGDDLLWFAYPKGSSRKYHCEFNRDTGWNALREAGFDSVRVIAIDEDWSALRFRRIKYVNSPARG